MTFFLRSQSLNNQLSRWGTYNSLNWYTISCKWCRLPILIISGCLYSLPDININEYWHELSTDYTELINPSLTLPCPSLESLWQDKKSRQLFKTPWLWGLSDLNAEHQVWPCTHRHSWPVIPNVISQHWCPSNNSSKHAITMQYIELTKHNAILKQIKQSIFQVMEMGTHQTLLMTWVTDTIMQNLRKQAKSGLYLKMWDQNNTQGVFIWNLIFLFQNVWLIMVSFQYTYLKLKADIS
jgi:hypothetical protein